MEFNFVHARITIRYVVTLKLLPYMGMHFDKCTEHGANHWHDKCGEGKEMAFFSKLLRRKSQADVEEEVDETGLSCPICVQLRRWAQIRSIARPWNDQRNPLPPVRRQTHHVAGVDYNMCLEHYDVISAYLWLEWTEPARRQTRSKIMNMPKIRPLFEPHDFQGPSDVIGGNCRICGGSIVEPWHRAFLFKNTTPFVLFATDIVCSCNQLKQIASMALMKCGTNGYSC